MLQLGKLPATPDNLDLKFANYVISAALPERPAVFGHQHIVGARAWGMLGNDEWGDCAWAGPGHETMILTSSGPTGVKGRAHFTAHGVLSDYAAGTGFNPADGPPGRNPTDQGSYVRDVLKYRQKTGIVDSHGRRHTIGAYTAVPLDVEQILTAAWLFEACGLGLRFPDSAMVQFNQGKPWTVVPGTPEPQAGHYVPVVGVRKNGMVDVVTWGALQPVAPEFIKTYADEAWACVSEEMLADGKSPEGFDLDTLERDLAGLRAR